MPPQTRFTRASQARARKKQRPPIEARLFVTRSVDIYQWIERANYEALKDIGAYIRATAKRMAPVRKHSSSPGDAWVSHKPAPLRRTIAFAARLEQQDLVVGPSKGRNARTAPKALEYGGPTTAILKVLPMEAHQQVQAYKENKRRHKTRMRSDAEKDAIDRYFRYEHLDPKRWKRERQLPHGVRKRVTYHMRPRPLMHISMWRSQNYTQAAWKRAVAIPGLRKEKYFGRNGMPLAARARAFEIRQRQRSQ